MIDAEARSRKRIDPIVLKRQQMISRKRKLVMSPTRTGCMWNRSVMPVVFQLMTMLISTKREMQLSSVSPSCVSAPPFCVVRLVRLLVNWYSQSTPELALGRAWANRAIADISDSLSNQCCSLWKVRLPGLALMCGGGVVFLLVLLDLLPEGFVSFLLLLGVSLLLLKDGGGLLGLRVR